MQISGTPIRFSYSANIDKILAAVLPASDFLDS
jgi:hypothetical protein